MAEVITGELSTTDQAFAGNRLLAALDREARALMESHGTIVELGAGDPVLRRGAQVSSSLFPFGSTMIAMVVDLPRGRSIQVASIGREGAVGGIVSCGHAPAFTRATVLVPGPALCVSMAALEDAKHRSPLIKNLFCRYSDYLLAQTMQNVACNAFHNIPQRTARWLLHAQDRAGDRIGLTQEVLAGLLGVQRTTLNAVIADFSSEALILTRRGTISVLSRPGLEQRSCVCYDVLQSHYAGVIGKTGSGQA